MPVTLKSEIILFYLIILSRKVNNNIKYTKSQHYLFINLLYFLHVQFCAKFSQKRIESVQNWNQ